MIDHDEATRIAEGDPRILCASNVRAQKLADAYLELKDENEGLKDELNDMRARMNQLDIEI